MDFASAFLGVIAIIGIIIVGGFVIFFLGDLVLSILDPNYVRFSRRSKEESKKEPIQIENPEETKEIEFKDPELIEVMQHSAKETPVIEQGLEDDFFGDEKVNKEEKEINLEQLRAEEEQFKANMLKAIEERKLKSHNDEESDKINFEKFFFDDDDIDVFGEERVEEENEEIEGQENFTDLIENEEIEDISTQPAVETENQRIEELKQQFESEILKLEDERKLIVGENTKLKSELLEAKEEISKMASKKESKKTEPSLGLEEYEDRLEKLRERLAENDKDLRKVKKDFMPLKKVKSTLENDEKKLRRKEAVVAKQKVVLYGVNNIVDIDQEKAKKLTEELDLLDGLKLSVKHCQEVMEANKDRYPILENTYNILVKNNELLKADIEETEETIAKIKAKK